MHLKRWILQNKPSSCHPERSASGVEVCVVLRSKPSRFSDAGITYEILLSFFEKSYFYVKNKDNKTSLEIPMLCIALPKVGFDYENVTL